MALDPNGSGVAPNDLLIRRGVNWESAGRLARQADLAEQAGKARNGHPFGFGISVTTPEANRNIARDLNDAAGATRQAFENAGFEVRFTPTGNDADHHTVILPKPVTEAVATLFNTILGRKRKGN